MNTLVPQLLDLLRGLEPAPGVPADAIRGLLRAFAVSVIQQDATQANIPPGDIDPLIVEAIQAAVEQVAILKKTFTRLRLVPEILPVGAVAGKAGEQVSETFGPFVQRPGQLVRFTSFQSGAFLAVIVPLVQPNITEALLLIPAASTPDGPDLRTWTLAPGSVWINSRFLVLGATGFAGLRIAGGKLDVAAGTFKFRSSIVIPALSDWSLSVVPEPAPPPGAGSDADALALTLPTSVGVVSDGVPIVSGAPVFSGFGSDLHFTFSGAPFLDGHQVAFPMRAAEPTWSIAGNASSLAAFSGESPVPTASYQLPLSDTPIASLAEAAHGGSLVVRLSGVIASVFAAQQGGPSNWVFTTLTANALRIELHSGISDSSARYDFNYWNACTSSIRFAQQSLSGLFFRSERGAIDTVAVLGGAIGNKWDLPCGAGGQPFPFAGRSDIFGIFANPSGSWVTVSATASVPDPLQGLALENLYLIVKAPGKLFAISPFDTAPLLASGIAILLFDVNFAVPTLPDPYAANLPLPDPQAIVANALGIHFSWADAATPALRTFFQQQVQFPEPRFDGPADDDDRALLAAFHTHISSQPEFLYLLDMSGKEHLLGVALESPSDNPAELLDNRLAFPMRNIRLLMPPQVLWEPVQIEPNPLVPELRREVIHSDSQGGPTLIGANSVTLVPTLPQPVTAGILEAIRLSQPSAALFSLPFGLRAVTRLSPPEPLVIPLDPPGAITELHEPVFETLSAARQFRITARNNAPVNVPLGQLDPSRSLPGMMRQLGNLQRPNNSGLTSVTPFELMKPLNSQFADFVPLQHADLSGYGLSSFSQWILAGDEGFTKAEFQVLNGRTAYEVLQFRSILYECGARVVRTVILERHNSGRVVRSDSGWLAVDSGLFTKPVAFAKGAVRSFQNIRQIRITGDVIHLFGDAAVQPVIFDADVDIEGHAGGLTPVYNRPGYIQIESAPPPPFDPKVSPLPPKPLAPLTDVQLAALFVQVGPIGGPIDCAVRLGKTLEMQISTILSDVALDDTGRKIGFAVAVVGSPKLPRAGQWSVMRIDPATREVSPVDPRRGVPVVQVGSAFRFREPSDALRTPRIQHGLLICTESSRVLFPQPFIDVVQPAGTLQFDLPPIMADPYSLIQSTSHFPRPGFALGLKEKALFHIAEDNHWRIDAPEFNIDTTPAAGLMQGGDWSISRGYQTVPPPPGIPAIPTTVKLAIDSAAAAALNIAVPRSNLNLDLPAPLNSILKIHTNYETVAGGLPKLATPTLEFSGALQELTDILNSLSELANLPFEFNVTVTAGGGASPSFVVHMKMNFRVGKSPEERVDVGMGKFYGEFTVIGELEAALTGVNRALLFLEFKGDMQQGILPPLLYAGGVFRFSIELHDKGSPTIQLGLGVVFSIGGDLIPGLVAVEATVHYGYTLDPIALEPGVFIGLDARAKLLGGLIGFSFGVEAMARIKRKDQGVVTVWAQIRVAGSVQVAFFLEEDFDFQTQFQLDLPMAALSLIPGVGILPAAASLL